MYLKIRNSVMWIALKISGNQANKEIVQIELDKSNTEK